MSVQSEITRLQNAKSSISSAITGKGVTVPSDTTLNGMADLISSIKTGSDPAEGGLQVARGTFMPASSRIEINVTGLGFKPKYVFVFCISSFSSSTIDNYFLSTARNDVDGVGIAQRSYKASASLKSYNIGIKNIPNTDDSIAFTFTDDGFTLVPTACVFQANPHAWYAFG